MPSASGRTTVVSIIAVGRAAWIEVADHTVRPPRFWRCQGRPVGPSAWCPPRAEVRGKGRAWEAGQPAWIDGPALTCRGGPSTGSEPS